ncbi:MAG: FAD-dependent oxidoreductase [Deltaproteobacteria bacterium]|nr:FAD-dependent oxidoreductase [Deltaproteobacteria bacterium]
MTLFERTRIGTMEVKNRVAMAPMGTAGLADSDLGYSRRLIEFYAARAQGATGMIITGAAIANTRLEGGLAHFLPRLDSPKYVSRLSELCDAVHHYDAKLVLQLSAGFGRVNYLLGNTILPPISASEVPCFHDPSVTTRALTVEEIGELMMSFAMAAAMAKMAGVDAIEIQGYGGYLIDQFQSALWNRRTDHYGGDLDGRLRFSLELIGATRSLVGPDFPIIYKFTPDHYIPGGRQLDEGLEIARRLERAGVDALHVDGGCYEVWHRVIPSMYEAQACQIPLAQAVKQVVKLPVIAHGKLGNPAVAKQVIEDGQADFVALGRPLLADPAWAKKVKQGRIGDIRPCIACNETCLGKKFYVSCTVNPQTGMERDYALVPVGRKRKVLVIGGGPGGLEAARAAAARGCEVTLWEQTARLGGKMHVAAVPEFKRDIRPLIRFLSTEVEKAGVKVELQKAATPTLVQQHRPDVVIVATGSQFKLPAVPGVESRHVLNTVELYQRPESLGERVLVVGGGLCGCEAAVYLAQQGRRVTIVEMMPEMVPQGSKTINTILAIKALLAQAQVTVMTSTKLVEITPRGAMVERNGGREELAADSVVIATGFTPDLTLRDALEQLGTEAVAVGDCNRPRTIQEAIWEGYHAARVIS